MRPVTITNGKHAFFPIGPQASGKSTLAKEHFNPHEVISADAYREQLAGHLLYNTEIDKAAWKLLYSIVEIQTENEVPLFLDNLNIDGKSRRKLVAKIREQGYTIHYIIMDTFTDEDELIKRNQQRGKNIPERAIISTYEKYCNLTQHQLEQEADEIHHATNFQLNRAAPQTITTNHAVFIGDVHGQYEKLQQLLAQHGYYANNDGTDYTKLTSDDYPELEHSHPTLIFVGDLVDRGPQSLECLRIVKKLIENGDAAMVLGNHEQGINNFLTVDDPYAKADHGGWLHKGSGQSRKTVHEQIHPQTNFDEQQELSTFLNTLPLLIEANVGNKQYIITHAGTPYYHDDQPGTYKNPTKYHQNILLRGYKTGNKVRDTNYGELLPVWQLTDNNHDTAPTQIYGHVNQSYVYPEQYGEGHSPHIVEKTIGIENKAEFIPENPIGVYEATA